MRSLFSFFDRFFILLIKLLNFVFYLPERYIIRKLNFNKNSIYLIYREFNYLNNIKYYKFL